MVMLVRIAKISVDIIVSIIMEHEIGKEWEY